MSRIKVTGGPWRERVGCFGWIVADPGDGVYPFTTRLADEVVVLLDIDPLVPRGTEPTLSNGMRWSCVMRLENLARVT